METLRFARFLPPAKMKEPEYRPQLKRKCPAMKNMILSNISFLEWTKLVSTQHPDILEHMRKSTDPFDRAIAKRIMQTAGMEKNDKSN